MLDKKDQRIVRELILDSSIPLTALAKKTGVSREVAFYRMNRLAKEKIILGYYTLINYKALGFKRYGIFIQLKGITPEKEELFLEYLVNHPFVTFLGPVIGKWNMVFDVLVRDDDHLNAVIKEITREVKIYLDNLVVAGLAMKEEVFPTKFLGEKNLDHISEPETKAIAGITIDDIDKAILKMVSRNARIEYAELARKLKMSGNAIKTRIKNLEKKHIILGYTTSINYWKLGLEYYNIQFKLHAESAALISHIRRHPLIFHFYRYLGNENADMDMGVCVKDGAELRNLLLELKQSFGEILKIHDIYVITAVSKDNVAPEGLFE